jgi:hypothetical protein
MIMDKKKKKISKILIKEDNISNFKILKIEKGMIIIMKISKLKMKKNSISSMIEHLISSFNNQITVKDKIKGERLLDKDQILLKLIIQMTKTHNQVS